MSKTITIKQDGIAQTYNNINIIGTRNDTGSGDWIPEDEAKTTFKKITQNGQYVAKDRDDVAGYTAVFVNVPHKTITGIDRNDGKTYEISLDGNGNIVKREVTT